MLNFAVMRRQKRPTLSIFKRLMTTDPAYQKTLISKDGKTTVIVAVVKCVGPESGKQLVSESFPNAVHIAGYGNTLFGLCMEITESVEGYLDYYSPGTRLVVQVVSKKDGIQPYKNRLTQIVDYGEEGQVLFHRLDESFFIPNMFEQDKAIRIEPSTETKYLGVYQDGVRNPTLLKGLEANAKVGVY